MRDFGLSGRKQMEEAENGLGNLQPPQERDNRVQVHHRSVGANGEGVRKSEPGAKALGSRDLTAMSAGQERAEVSLWLPSLGDLAQPVFWDACLLRNYISPQTKWGGLPLSFCL